MKIFKALLSLLMLAVLIVTALFIDFTYKTFSARPRQVQVDAIVVLAGGKGRVEEGVRLFKERRANWLFLVGVNPTVRKSDLYRPKQGDPSSDNVVLEKLSRNTLENAIYGRDILAEHKVRSVLLITSRYHLKRSAILFRNALPAEVAVYPYPVDSSNVKEEWWHHVGTFRLLFSEFYKYCIFRVFFLFSPGELRPVSL
ncbi:MAG: YdcF family protein [Geobacteraceae bacterium]|nr:YdcF family protein [Geobacteraceae bacterium]